MSYLSYMKSSRPARDEEIFAVDLGSSSTTERKSEHDKNDRINASCRQKNRPVPDSHNVYVSFGKPKSNKTGDATCQSIPGDVPVQAPGLAAIPRRMFDLPLHFPCLRRLSYAATSSAADEAENTE